MKRRSTFFPNTIYETYFEDHPRNIDFDALKAGDVVIIKEYFDEMKNLLEHELNWIRVGTEGRFNAQELQNIFRKSEILNEDTGHTKIDWSFSIEYLGRTGDRHIVKCLYSKSQDLDGSCSYIQKPIEDIKSFRVSNFEENLKLIIKGMTE